MEDERMKEIISKEKELNPAVPEKLPDSTFWPITLAFGVVFLFWGLITNLILTGVGLVAIGFSVAGWIGNMNHE
jgi:hypothetical protein